MNIPHIQINQQFSRIGLEQQRGRLEMETPVPIVKITQEQGTVLMERTSGQLTIDSRKAWSALGHAGFEEVTDRIAQSSLEISMQNIANISSEGDRMMAFHTGEKAFGEIARDQAIREYPIEICGEANYDNVDISYNPGQLSTVWKAAQIQFNFERTEPSIDYYPGKINPYLIQKNYIFFATTGQQLDAVI